jgi:CheY-like chemotaxis protein
MARLLLVEDNEMNRDMLSRRLMRKGHEVEIAVDGQEGIEMARALGPDLALTAHAMSDDRQKALEAGCDDYDTKPVDLPRLLDKIQRLLGGGISSAE